MLALGCYYVRYVQKIGKRETGFDKSDFCVSWELWDFMPWDFTPSSDLSGGGNCQYVTNSPKLSRRAPLELSENVG